MARVLALLAQCPYCSAKLRKAPTRSHRCSKCKEQFHIWDSPEGEVFVVTEDELHKLSNNPDYGQNKHMHQEQNRPFPMSSKDEMFPFGVRRKLTLNSSQPPTEPLPFAQAKSGAFKADVAALPSKNDLHLFQSSRPSLPEEMLEQIPSDICPDCKLAITEEMAFCPRCGCKCEFENKSMCKGCKLATTAEMIFCPRCGTDLEQ